MDYEVKQRFKLGLQEQIANKVSLSGTDDETVKALIKQTVTEAAELSGDLTEEERDGLIEDFINEFLYFGPLQPLLADETISEIMVNGGGMDSEGNWRAHEVWVERDGVISRCENVRFDGEEHVRRIMNRICARQGRRIDDSNPIEDASLPDGSRFNGTVYPVAVDGSCFNIRRFSQDMLTADELVDTDSASKAEMEFLLTCVAARCSVLISGGTGSGKTTLLNVLASAIPEHERIITIEDTCELLVHRQHEHVLRLEARKPNAEGAGEITLDDHLRASLRKRPDRIIIGECRGAEAYTMLEAMNTGHEGSMTTIHANDPTSALTRLMTLAKQGDSTLSEETVKAKIAAALDIVVQIQRSSDGSRKITSIEAIGDYVDGHIQHEQLFYYDKANGDELEASHKSNHLQPPQVREKIANAGYVYDPMWFIDDAEAA